MKKTYANQSIYAILGFLHDCDMSGYDIRKRAQETVGYFWHESEGHLYPTLQRMVKSGLIKEGGASRRNARKRKQYSITEFGKEKLKEWLATPVEEGRVRNSFLLKLFFSKKMKPAVIHEHLERELFKRKEQMAIYKRIQDDIKNSDKNDQHTQLWSMTLDYGLRHTQCWIDWLQDSMKLMAK